MGRRRAASTETTDWPVRAPARSKILKILSAAKTILFVTRTLYLVDRDQFWVDLILSSKVESL